MAKIEFLNLGKQPITNNFLNNPKPKNEFFYDLKITFDEKSKIVSLSNFVPPEKMFNETTLNVSDEEYTKDFLSVASGKILRNTCKQKIKEREIVNITFSIRRSTTLSPTKL